MSKMWIQKWSTIFNKKTKGKIVEKFKKKKKKGTSKYLNWKEVQEERKKQKTLTEWEKKWI